MKIKVNCFNQGRVNLTLLFIFPITDRSGRKMREKRDERCVGFFFALRRETHISSSFSSLCSIASNKCLNSF